jgi:hypothetical protein
LILPHAANVSPLGLVTDGAWGIRIEKLARAIIPAANGFLSYDFAKKYDIVNTKNNEITANEPHQILPPNDFQPSPKN